MKLKKIGSLTLAALFTFSAAYTAAAAEKRRNKRDDKRDGGRFFSLRQRRAIY